MKNILGLVLALLLASGSLVAQNAAEKKSKFRVDFATGYKVEGSLGYNFFISDDKATQELFQTTVMGFGSGFIFDIFNGRASVDAIDIGWDKLNLTLGVGYSITKYRFANNLIIEPVTIGGITATGVRIDDDPTHDYVNTFFGYGKSKIVYGTINFPVHVNFKLGAFKVSAGPILEMYVSGKHKRKYKVDDKKIKDKVGNSDFRNYDINKNKTGVNLYLTHKSGITVGATYMITPFFDSPFINDINEVRFAFGYTPPAFGLNKSKKKQEDEIKSI